MSCMVALIPAALLHSRFQAVPPHCTVADALQSLVAVVLQHLDSSWKQQRGVYCGKMLQSCEAPQPRDTSELVKV